MNEREALKLALEALDCICSPLHVREIEKIGNAMKAIREALAQSDQESDDLTIAYMSGVFDGKNKDAPQRKPLTDDLYNELLFAVSKKHQNETRHQTALRYILQAEENKEQAAKSVKGE